MIPEPAIVQGELFTDDLLPAFFAETEYVGVMGIVEEGLAFDGTPYKSIRWPAPEIPVFHAVLGSGEYFSIAGAKDIPTTRLFEYVGLMAELFGPIVKDRQDENSGIAPVDR